MTGTVTRPGTLGCVVPSQCPHSEVSLASTQWMNLLHMSGSFRKTSKVGEFYIQSNAGRSRDGRRMSASEHAPQALADIVREPSTFTESVGLAGELIRFHPCQRHEGTRWYLGHNTFTLSDFRGEPLMTLTPAVCAGRVMGTLWKFSPMTHHTSPLRQVMSRHAGKLGG